MVRNGDIARFMQKVAKSESGCWEWTAGKKSGGYGVFYLAGKLRGAHRASLYLFKGLDIEAPREAMHSCDNPSCVNPDHLSYGSHTDNMRDASAKGRTVRVQDWRGQLNPKAKLSEGAAEQITSFVRSGATRAEASRKFGVSSVRVSQILKAAGCACEHSATEVAKLVRQAKTHCKRGHALSGENLRLNTAGGRVCKACVRANIAERRAARNQALP